MGIIRGFLFLLILTSSKTFSENISLDNYNIEAVFSDIEDIVETDSIELPLSANAWVTKRSASTHEVITSDGLKNWMSEDSIVSVYFYVKNPINFKLFIKCKVPKGKSQISVSIGQTSRMIYVEGSDYQWFSVGKVKLVGSGYIRLDLKGVKKTGTYFADVSHLKFSHKKDPDCIKIIRDIDTEFINWSRSGPSVHLFYELDGNETDEYYYNELTVPEGCDPIGSYFMAIGFSGGYFGIQVNSETERRVLFSVWSPQETDDPKQLLEENIVETIAKNCKVKCNVFGNEGCGGQSFLVYKWLPEVTYKFLVRGRPDPNDSCKSIYTAWFAPKTDNTWNLIASFKRSESDRFLTGFYSFVESFDITNGFMGRMALFGNQWVCDSSGKWREVTKTELTGDSTAEKKVRLDFDGGVVTREDNTQVFYLRICGFLEGKTQLLTKLTRNPNKNEPQIDFQKLVQQ